MTIEGTFAFRGPRAAVWDLLLDPAVLAAAMPGAKRLERTAEDRYEGVMKVGLGPVTAAEFTLTVSISDKQPLDHFTMAIDSKGSLGFTRGTARVDLADAADGGTTMRYRSELQIGGRIAAVGQRVVDSAARAMTEKGLEALQRALDERLARAKDSPR
jgi:carbon monoxide dehydrogenase subunit G